MVLSPFLVAGISAIASWFFLKAFIPSLGRFLLDQPNGRSSHRQPTPRGGGVVFVLLASVSSVLAISLFSSTASAASPILSSPLLVLPLALVGFLDDRINLPASCRYLVHLATALLVISISPLEIYSIGLLAMLVIAFTAVVNFVNFMDGVDGLVAGSMLLALTSAAVHLVAPWPIWSLVGALLGFLPWNWSPAKVFMGDVGSTFLGAFFATLVLQASNWTEALGMLLVASPLLGDSFFCVLRRLLAGQHVFQAHRLHLFQRLHQAGWPHERVSCLYISATALLAFAFLWGGLPWVITVASLELLPALWLDQHVAVPFVVASRTEI